MGAQLRSVARKKGLGFRGAFLLVGGGGGGMTPNVYGKVFIKKGPAALQNN